MKSKILQLHDKHFEVYIPEESIKEQVKKLAVEINRDFEGKHPLAVVVLNGGFIFASDLIRLFDFPCEVSFVKIKSYVGMQTGGDVKLQLDVQQSIKGRDVLIIEDIVDTGYSMDFLIKHLEEKGAESIRLAIFTAKPEALKCDVKIDYCAFELPNAFVVGYGLDYDEMGRQQKDLYRIVE